MNRSREVVAIMGKITSGCSMRDVAINCKNLLNIFSLHPEIKEHLITHFGVTPILEMFEATQCLPQAHRGFSAASMSFDPLHSRSSSGAYDSDIQIWHKYFRYSPCLSSLFLLVSIN